MSLYNQLAERGYEVRIWPALYPELNMIEKYQGRLAPMITKNMEGTGKNLAGKSTDPMRFSEEELSERRISYGRAGFALQFMLDTSLSDADRYPLKVSDLIIQNLNPEMAHTRIAWATSPDLCIHDVPTVALTGDRYYRPMWHSDDMADYTGCVMAIDPSGRGSDETGYAVVKVLAGNLFLVDCGGLTGGYDEKTLEELAKVASQHKVKHVIIEANFGDGMYTQLFKPILGRLHPCTVDEVKHSKQKELRIIDTLEPVMSGHRLVVDRRLIEKDFNTAKDIKFSLFYQMTRLTKDRGSLLHDDRLDALAIAVAYWSEVLARDNEKAAQDIKNSLLEKELRNWHKGVIGNIGGKPKGKSWVSNNAGIR